MEQSIIINWFSKPHDVENKILIKALIAFFIFIFIIWYALYHWNRRKLYQMAAARKGPPTWPIIGNALDVVGSNQERLANLVCLMRTYESAFPLWMGQKLYFVLTDPKHLEAVMNSPYGLKKDSLYKFGEPIMGLGLFTSPVHTWKKHRKLISPSFNQKILNSFVDIFSEQAEILTVQLEKVAGTGCFHVFNYFSNFTLDVLCETAMGIVLNAQGTNSDFSYNLNKAMEVGFKRMLTLWYHNDFIFNLTAMSHDFKVCCERMDNFIASVVKEKKEAYLENLKENPADLKFNYEDSSHNTNTVLHQLIKLSEEGANLTSSELSDELKSIILAGMETTASVTSYFMVMMGLHPDIQDKVYHEIMDVLGHDRSVDSRDLSKLPYTEMVIKETMRIFPSGPFLSRSITGDINLGDCTLSEGCSVIFGIVHVHRDPKIWPNPLKFDPLRFLPEECAKRHPYSFVPFSGGPRNCIGLNHAMMFMKTLIVNVLKKYKVTTTYKSIQEIKLKADTVLKPVDGYNINLEFRDNFKEKLT